MHLEQAGCSLAEKMKIDLAVEEIFINIASYAYPKKNGEAVIRVSYSKDPAQVCITFMDRGIPYNPLARDDPDVTLPAVKRQIGGLGIFLTKKTMDEVAYEYKDGHNILKLTKKLQGV
ncbi:MAG: ATP-binding protein [Lachnospiraceae bacterium]|nr:ATP-binding protein [Lachnospiraceae bacterium]